MNLEKFEPDSAKNASLIHHVTAPVELDGDWEIEHPPECLEECVRCGHAPHAEECMRAVMDDRTEPVGSPCGCSGGWGRFDCDVQLEIENAGLDAYFVHPDQPDPWRAEVLEPGRRYPFVWWFERHWTWQGDEYDTGLRILESE